MIKEVRAVLDSSERLLRKKIHIFCSILNLGKFCSAVQTEKNEGGSFVHVTFGKFVTKLSMGNQTSK